jgi:hypothetical protein
MNHKFHCKRIGNLHPDTLFKLSHNIVNLNYEVCRDFPASIIQVSDKLDSELLDLVKMDLSSLIKIKYDAVTNIARMSPKSYLAEHNDLSTYSSNANRLREIIKLQIPIITNDKVFMMWKYSQSQTQVEHLEVGGVYVINNLIRHSVVNGGTEYRYNLTVRYAIDAIVDQSIID